MKVPPKVTGASTELPSSSSAITEPIDHGRLLPLDGLRAVAIIMVIAQHSSLLNVGWAGVHVFFVLSGFLITGILRRDRAQPHFWSRFYFKRAARILPPLLVFFLICAFTAHIRWKTIGLAYVFFGANIISALPTVPVSDLTVLWSLAVEEHFYLLWPFAIRFLERRTLIVLSLALVVLDPLARAVATWYFARWQPIYFLTPFQLDGLAAGSFLALLVENSSWRAWLRRYAIYLAPVPVVLFVLLSRQQTFLRESNSVLFNSLGYSFIVLASFCILSLLVLRPHGILGQVLGWRPFVFLGSISYGLYLYNGPIMHEVEDVIRSYGFHHGRVILCAGLTVALVLSWVSFRLYESPIVHAGRRRASALRSEGPKT